MKIILGDFNAKVGRENMFKPTIGNESLHEISNDNVVRVVNFATSKNLVVKSTMFPHRKIHKRTWTSPEGNTHNQIDHILIDRRRHSSILDDRSFRGADCDTDHYLVVAKVRERLALSKRAAQKIDRGRFNVKKLNERDVKEHYQVTIRNKFAALENLEDSGDINGAWDNIRENIKSSAKESLGYCESKHRKPWFDEKCSKLVDRRKQAKLQWLQHPSEANEDDLIDVRREDSRQFRHKRREYLKDRINELESNSMNKNIRDLYRGINEFKKVTNLELTW
jgi:DNA repair ATPase RecN